MAKPVQNQPVKNPVPSGAGQSSQPSAPFTPSAVSKSSEPSMPSLSSKSPFPKLPMANPSLLLVLLALASILIILSFFILGPINKFKKTAEILIPDDKIASLALTNPDDQQRFKELVTINQNGENKATAENLIKAFVMLSNDYSRLPTSLKREVLIEINQYLSQNFPNEAKGANLQVPCREASCGANFEYSEELLKLQEKVAKSSALTSELKTVIKTNLDNMALAAGSGNTDLEFNSLSTAFYNVKNAWITTKDSELAEIAKELLTLLEMKDPKKFKLGVADGNFELK